MRNKASVSKKDRDPVWLGVIQQDMDLVASGLKACPEVVHSPPLDHSTWLALVVDSGNVEIAELMINSGCPIDVVPSNGKDTTTPLIAAIYAEQVDMVRLFLEKGADPNYGFPIGSIGVAKGAEAALKIIKLLIEYGANVNHHYLEHDPKYAYTILDRAQTEDIRQLLLQHGAKTSADLYAEKGHSPANDRETPIVDVRQEVVAHFEKTIGPASKKSLIQIVPTGVPIGIHFIPPKDNRKHLTLFTNGLSSEPMNVPEGAEEYRFAELFIELPGDWKIKEVKDMRWAWPLYCERSVNRILTRDLV
jgi:hypothetical protein